MTFLPTSSRAGQRRRAGLFAPRATTSFRARQSSVDQPDILIVEGLNILQPGELPSPASPIVFASDFIDFSIYIDADETDLRDWFMERFVRLRQPHSPTPTSSTASVR